MDTLLKWLLESDEPWTRYHTLLDLLEKPQSDPQVQAAREEMLRHPQVLGLAAEAAGWPGYAFTRHNDARHPIYKVSTLADFGLRRDDPGMAQIVDAVLDHQSSQGAFLSLLNIPKAFGGSGEDTLTWVACDAPTLLYALLAYGMGEDARVQRAVAHLAGLAGQVGWGCAAAPELGKFHGPGKRSDPCPIANVYALKALSLAPGMLDSPVAQAGVEMLLGHWAARKQRKYYLFAMGSDFSRLKFPFIWYDLLHVVDVLSRFPFARRDERLHEMVAAITAQAGADGRYTAGSMYQAWKGWSFADKKNPSPWLTYLVLRIQKRIG
ncbi:MAG: hypothetical protein JW726_19880 [Anaerolineales bacterium]|nr:hypothetical protein [Anaerolineales bacterium]